MCKEWYLSERKALRIVSHANTLSLYHANKAKNVSRCSQVGLTGSDGSIFKPDSDKVSFAKPVQTFSEDA